MTQEPINPLSKDVDKELDAQEPMMKFFHFKHLPPKLQEISSQFWNVACSMTTMLPRNAERTAMFRKLLEAKDCAVRATL